MTPEKYISLILIYLKDEAKIPKIDNKEEKREYEIDVFSETFFANLYHNIFIR